jgi:hypothetical protein
LNDSLKVRILWPFLTLASDLSGILVVFTIDNAVKTIFEDKKIDNNAPAKWDGYSYEKVMRIIHLISLLISGLSRSGQNVLWITDQDEIVANVNRIYKVTELLATVSSNILTHNLGHLRVASTASDKDNQLEDLAAIPDLACGAVSDLMTKMKLSGGFSSIGLTTLLPTGIKTRTRLILSWIAEPHYSLVRLCIRIYKTLDGKLNIQNINIHPLY